MVSHSELTEKDLINQHRDLLETFMNNTLQWELSIRKKVLALYEQEINKENIRYYINRDIKVFLQYLIQGKVRKAAKYFPKGYHLQES